MYHQKVSLPKRCTNTNTTVVDQIEVMPDWFLKPPTSESSIYSVGTAVSPDLQLTVDIAVLNAKTTLADRINGRVRSQTKTFIAKIGSEETDTSILSEVEKVNKRTSLQM